MKTYAEYQAGVGDKRRGPAGRRATDRSFSLAQGKNNNNKKWRTGEEELGDEGTGRSLDNVIWLQKTY